MFGGCGGSGRFMLKVLMYRLMFCLCKVCGRNLVLKCRCWCGWCIVVCG